MRQLITVLSTAILLSIAVSPEAALTPEHVNQLGTRLTPLGANPEANADGSIPAYTGGLTKSPEGFNDGDTIRPNPYADEKPVLVITKDNMDSYSQQLTDTTVELLKRYPSFRVDVFPTHRSASFPERLIENTRINALHAKSTEDGMALENVLPGVPFPIPSNGTEAMWNFLLRYQGVTFTSKYDSWNVNAAGRAILATTGQAFNSFPIYEDWDKPIESSDIFFQSKIYYTGPSRRVGEAVMIKDAVNPMKHPRRAWQYLPGVRRVKLAPNLAYDTPNPGTAGSSTYDDIYVFNGALDRYSWNLIGKQEMYVPYNTYDLTYIKDPAHLTTPNHLSPDYVRWEKHRVWVIEARLKEGQRHVYHKRRIYLDEDTWVALASDQYDARGQLYRGSFAFLSQSYDMQIPDATPHMIYHLIANTYNINGIVGPHGGIRYIDALPKTKWSADALAARGIR